jgi:hypothetical protein
MTQASDGMGIQRRQPGVFNELWIGWKKELDRNIWGRIIKEAKVHKGLWNQKINHTQFPMHKTCVHFPLVQILGN